MSKQIRLECEFDDGTIYRLIGPAAEEWNQIQGGACALSMVHNCELGFDKLPWEKFSKVGGPPPVMDIVKSPDMVKDDKIKKLNKDLRTLGDALCLAINELTELRKASTCSAVTCIGAVKKFPFADLDKRLHQALREAGFMPGWSSSRGVNI